MSRPVRGLLGAALSVLLAASLVPPAGAARPAYDDRGPTRAQAEQALRRVQELVTPSAGARGDARRAPAGAAERGDLTVAMRDLFRARQALDPSQRRRAAQLLARPSDAGGDPIGFDYRPVSFDGQTVKSACPDGGVVCVHWVETGPERLTSLVDGDTNGVPDYVDLVLSTVAQVWAHETQTLGFRTPLPDTGATGRVGNPDQRFDVYLADVGDRDLFGYCAPDGANSRARTQPGYCVLDNDYRSGQFGGVPLRSLQVTVAHELFHAIQFAYDLDEDVWFMEGTATWVEDQVYDAINDNYRYLRASAIRQPRVPLDTEAGFFPYGAFVFFTYASERRGAAVVRRFWEVAASPTVSSLAAIRAVVGPSQWPAFFALFTSWNTLPAGSYSERAAYPDPAWWQRRVLTRRKAGLSTRTVSLPHLTSASALFVPGSRLTRRARLVVNVDGPSNSPGATVLVQRRLTTGAVTHSLVRTNSRGDVRLRLGFDRRQVRSVAIVLTNTNPAGPGRSVKLRATVR